MEVEKLKEQIIAWRKVIRWHRDQVGDDRCWLDDWRVYEVVLELKSPDLPEHEHCLILCHQYHKDRSLPLVPPYSSDRVGEGGDDDLEGLSEVELLILRTNIWAAVNTHCAIGDGKRNKDDDLNLYAVLPDGVLPDQRLPHWETAFRPSCEKFIRSRTETSSLHAW